MIGGSLGIADSRATRCQGGRTARNSGQHRGPGANRQRVHENGGAKDESTAGTRSRAILRRSDSAWTTWKARRCGAGDGISGIECKQLCERLGLNGGRRFLRLGGRGANCGLFGPTAASSRYTTNKGVIARWADGSSILMPDWRYCEKRARHMTASPCRSMRLARRGRQVLYQVCVFSPRRRPAVSHRSWRRACDSICG